MTNQNTEAEDQVARLLVLERFDGVQAGGAVRGQSSKDDADKDGGGERDDGGEEREGDLEGGQEGDGHRDGEADDGADDTSREREEDGFGEELQADFARGGAEGLADADLFQASLDVGEHGVHDADAGDDEGDAGGEGEDDGEHVGDLAHDVEHLAHGEGVVDGGGVMATLDDGEDLL